MERQGVNAAFNSGALYWNGKYLLAVRVEGVDRKSFFAIAESPNGIDNFRFWDYPITLPETERPDTNVYDMRLTAHADGWIYGLFCTERKDLTRPEDTSAAEAQCGIARTKDLIAWERLPDLITYSGQQRNVVLHPEFIDGKYGLFTRPQDGFISVGGGGGIGWGLVDDMTRAEVKSEVIVDGKVYHTIKEVKNGQGPAPIKTAEGWLNLAHGVRNTAAGLRYTLYMFMTELARPWVVTHSPAGHFIAPHGAERVGDVSNVAFSNGWIVNEKNEVFMATSTVEKLIDYCKNTPADGLRSAASVAVRNELISANLKLLKDLV
jgi:4-O-beta-D-mannosyl-D-glucose phosphorylase